MKIGIEAQRLFRRNKHGMEVVSLELINHLQRIDNTNEYIIYVKKDLDKCIEETANFHINETPAYYYPYWEQIYLPKLVKQEKLDVLHCTSNTAPLNPQAPLMLTLHDIIYLEKVSFKGTLYQNFGNLYRRFVVPKIVDKCRSIITVSEFEKNKIVNTLNIPSSKVEVVYNAVNETFKVITNNSLLEQIREQYKLPEKFILFFGNTAPKKNTANTIAAYAQYHNNSNKPLQLLITDCSKKYISDIIKSLQCENKAAIEKNIIVIDHVPFSQVPLLYNLAALFLYPSLRESFGMPILEAMACGTPVITSNTSSMPEVAGNAALLINPHKSDDIAVAIEKVLTDSLLQDDMIKKGISRASNFTWQNTAEKVLQLYKMIA